uniref:Putative secreted protein n=2 Tax=Amblyomma TaxID=6942 RepID=A0A023FD11_AMBCJ
MPSQIWVLLSALLSMSSSRQATPAFRSKDFPLCRNPSHNICFPHDEGSAHNKATEGLSFPRKGHGSINTASCS